MASTTICYLSPPNLSADSQGLAPCRFIKISGENLADYPVAGCSAIGITQDFTDRVPNDGSFATATFIAPIGRTVPYHPVGTVCDLLIAGTIVAGAGIQVDGTTVDAGKGVTQAATAGILACAIALRGGASGDRIPVYIIAPRPYHATYN